MGFHVMYVARFSLIKDVDSILIVILLLIRIYVNMKTSYLIFG